MKKMICFLDVVLLTLSVGGCIWYLILKNWSAAALALTVALMEVRILLSEKKRKEK